MTSEEKIWSGVVILLFVLCFSLAIIAHLPRIACTIRGGVPIIDGMELTDCKRLP